MVYSKQNGAFSLESAAFDGGRFFATSSGVETRYYIADHLGSVRVIVDDNGEVIERNDFYPFGLRWNNDAAPIADNRYRYNAKEEQAFLALPYIDYGARMYDPKYNIRWNSVDPLAEKYLYLSPFAFCGNNPIENTDSNGLQYDKYYNSLGYLIYDTGQGDKTYVIKAIDYNKHVSSISEQEAINTERAISQGNLSGPHMQNIIEIESVPTLQKMRNTIKDDGTGGDSEDNNREYGGIVNKRGQIANVSQGTVRESEEASISINTQGARSVYHSHPSGSKNLPSYHGSGRLPSQKDYESIGTATGYIFQMRTKEIIVFDNKKVTAIISFKILDDL